MKMRLIVALAVMTAAALHADNRKLMEEAAADLKKLNQEVLNRIKDPARFNQQDIYVRVRVLPQPDGSKKMQVEKVTVGKVEKKAGEVMDKDVIYFKGKVEKADDKGDFKVDLSHVLPPEKEKEHKKTSAETGTGTPALNGAAKDKKETPKS